MCVRAGGCFRTRVVRVISHLHCMDAAVVEIYIPKVVDGRPACRWDGKHTTHRRKIVNTGVFILF